MIDVTAGPAIRFAIPLYLDVRPSLQVVSQLGYNPPIRSTPLRERSSGL